MTAYYAGGHSSARLDAGISREFAEAIAKEVSVVVESISDPRHVSPYGRLHKERMVEFVRTRQAADLTKSRRGETPIARKTALGLCVYSGSCSFGGYESLVECVKCSHALIDRHKEPQLRSLLRDMQREMVIERRDEQIGESLSAQERALNAALEILHARSL